MLGAAEVRRFNPAVRIRSKRRDNANRLTFAPLLSKGCFMRMQIASDLHLDALHHKFRRYVPLEYVGADVLILAGDIHARAGAVEAFAGWPSEVVYVHGNHEAYGTQYPQLLAEIRRQSSGTHVHFLEREERVIGDVRFLGACLWTDYNLYGNRSQSMEVARYCMSDHALIKANAHEFFSPEHALAEHELALDWLRTRLAMPFNGKTVVVTHHGVSPQSVHPRFQDDPINAGFVSDLRHIIELADISIHGHVHDSLDYSIGKTRVLANPRGNARNIDTARNVDALKWENSAYDPRLVIDI
jgi:predicted phosphodiesterase